MVESKHASLQLPLDDPVPPKNLDYAIFSRPIPCLKKHDLQALV